MSVVADVKPVYQRGALTPEVAAVLRRARLRLGWSQRVAAYWCGISAIYYQELETCRRRPSDRTAEKIIDGLGLRGRAVKMLRDAAVPGWGTRHGKPLVRAEGRGNRRPSGRKPIVRHRGSCLEHLAKTRYPWV
jgi:hypothetical protein